MNKKGTQTADEAGRPRAVAGEVGSVCEWVAWRDRPPAGETRVPEVTRVLATTQGRGEESRALRQQPGARTGARGLHTGPRSRNLGLHEEAGRASAQARVPSRTWRERRTRVPVHTIEV